MSHSPLHLSYSPLMGFRLTAKVTFNRQAAKQYLGEKSYKTLIIEGIEQNWSGNYPMTDELRSAIKYFFLKEKINIPLNQEHLSVIPFKVKIIEDKLSGDYSPRILYLKRFFECKTRPIPIFLKTSKILPSHVASGILRRFWGIFRTGQIESIGYNWSKNFPGFAVIDKIKNPNYLRKISAHEAGHLFGVGDAYGAWYRFFYAAPGTENYMMHHNQKVQPQEVAMLIKAYTKQKAQFFPRKFNLKIFIKGLAAEFKYYVKKLFYFLRNKHS